MVVSGMFFLQFSMHADDLEFYKHKGKRNVHPPKQITFLAERKD